LAAATIVPNESGAGAFMDRLWLASLAANASGAITAKKQSKSSSHAPGCRIISFDLLAKLRTPRSCSLS